MKKVSIGILGTLFGVGIGYAGNKYLKDKVTNNRQDKVDKFKGYYTMLNQWLLLKQEGKSLEKYFIDNGYKTVAIYGMGEMGNRLYDELKDSDVVEVKYAIDQNAADTYVEIDVRDIDDHLEEVDVIVVTATFAFEEIKESLDKKISYPIVSLEDVVYEV